MDKIWITKLLIVWKRWKRKYLKLLNVMKNVGPGLENWRHNSVKSAYITGMANMRYAYIPYHYGQMDKVPAFWEESADV